MRAPLLWEPALAKARQCDFPLLEQHRRAIGPRAPFIDSWVFRGKVEMPTAAHRCLVMPRDV